MTTVSRITIEDVHLDVIPPQGRVTDDDEKNYMYPLSREDLQFTHPNNQEPNDLSPRVRVLTPALVTKNYLRGLELEDRQLSQRECAKTCGCIALWVIAIVGLSLLAAKG